VTIRPFDVAAWVQELREEHSTPGVKQQLTAARMLFAMHLFIYGSGS